MQVIEQSRPAATPIPGVHHATWAGAAEGLSQLSVWRQSVAPGGTTPPHSHDCDEVVLCLSGEGEVQSQGRTRRFTAGSTVILPGNQVHQLFSVGTTALEIVGLFAATPVNTLLPDGQPLNLPWRT